MSLHISVSTNLVSAENDFVKEEENKKKTTKDMVGIFSFDRVLCKHVVSLKWRGSVASRPTTATLNEQHP